MAATGTTIPAIPPQYFTNTGQVAAGYKLFTYAAGTTNKLATYTDIGLTAANTNPIILDSAGRAEIFLQASSYKFVLAPPADTDPPSSPIWTRDNVFATPAFSANTDIIGTAGEDLVGGDVVYMSAGDGGLVAGRFYKASDLPNLYSALGAGIIAIVPQGATIGTGVAGALRLIGTVGGFTGLTIGARYYVGVTAGTLDVGNGQQGNARFVGVADTTTSITIPPPSQFTGTAHMAVAFGTGQSNGVGSVDTYLSSYIINILPNHLALPGDAIVLEGVLSIAANADNPKLFRISLGAGPITTIWSSAANVANHVVPFRCTIRRRTSTNASVTSIAWTGAASGGVPTDYMVVTTMNPVDFTVFQLLKLYGNSATAGTVKLTDFSIVNQLGLQGSTV
jgi:hypothetical protein